MMTASSKIFVILVGHGSRQAGFGEAMEKVASAIKKDRRFSGVSCAYLEVTTPSIEEAIAHCVKKKAKEIRVLPYFVLTGKHVVTDIPNLIKAAKKKHGRSVKIILCPYLGYDKKIVALVKNRILKLR